MPKIFSLNIEQSLLDTRILLNGFDVLGQNVRGGIKIEVPVNQFIVNGANTIRMDVALARLGSLPLGGYCRAVLMGPPHAGSSATDSQLLQAGFGSATNPTDPSPGFASDFPDVGIRVDSSVSDDGRTYSGSFTADCKVEMGVRRWEDGAIIDNAAKVIGELIVEYRKVHAMIARKEIGLLNEYCGLRIADYQSAFAFNSRAEAIDSLRLFDLIESDEWQLGELKSSGLRCELAGGNRVAHLVTNDGKPLIRLYLKGSSMCFGVRMMYSRIGPRWRVVI